MVTENNSYINSFYGGMNSDSSIAQMKNSQYEESRNVRITTFSNNTGSNQQGTIIPINGLRKAYTIPIDGKAKILATTTTRDYGVIVYSSNDRWHICRFKNAIGGDFDNDREFNEIKEADIKILGNFPVKDTGWENIEKLSITQRYEDENIIKLYIADGINPILSFNIAPSNDEYYDKYGDDIDKFKAYPKVIFNKPIFKSYIEGHLKSGLVAYSYQLYNKNGIATDISPACKFIPIGDYSYNEDVAKLKGAQQSEDTNSGVRIQIQNSTYSEFLNRIRVFRIQYHQNGQLPQISIIHDSGFVSDLTINDTGYNSQQDISVEEYNSMSGIHIIPKVLENKDDYLFAANVKTVETNIDQDVFKNWDSRSFSFYSDEKSGDIYSAIYDLNRENLHKITADNLNNVPLPTSEDADQTYKDCYNVNCDVNKDYIDNHCFDKTGTYYGGSGPNIDWRFIITQRVSDSCKKNDYDLEIGTIYNCIQKDNPNANASLSKETTENGVATYFVKKQKGGVNRYEKVSGLYTQEDEGFWRNPHILKSLRRDELYRYGIILYDQNGSPSPVKWIADIRTPNVNIDGFETFVQNGVIDGQKYGLITKPLGIAFKVSNLPEQCTGYEIVRCSRGEEDIATISQGIVARSVKPIYNKAFRAQRYSTYSSPTYFTTSNFIAGFWTKIPFYNQFQDREFLEDYIRCVTNINNKSVYQFASPEVCYQPESFKTLTKSRSFYLSPIKYLFGCRGDKNYKRNACDSNYYVYMYESGFDPFNWTNGDNYGFSSLHGAIFPAVSNSGAVLSSGFGDKNYKSVILDSYVQRDFAYKSTIHENKDTCYRATINLTCPLYNKSVYDWDTSLYDTADDNNLHKCDNLESANASNFYTYIKLYNQAVSTYNTADPSKDRINIKDIKVSNDVIWNDLFQEKKYKNYTSKSQAVSGNEYCNVVSNGFYGMAWAPNGRFYDGTYYYCKDNIYRGTNDRWTFIGQYGYNERIAFSNIGCAGRCAILCLDGENDTVLNTTLGATSYNITGTSYNQLLESSKLCDYRFGLPRSGTIERNSALGTYLCNLRKVTTPYGGSGLQYRQFNSYYSDGDYFNNSDEWVSVFDGDTDVNVFEYTSMHKYYYTEGAEHTASTNMIIYAIPVESSIRLNYTYGEEPSKVLDKDGSSWLQLQPSSPNGYYTQTDPMYVYNTSYTSENKLRTYTAFDEININDFNKSIDYRCYSSNRKDNSESVDSWLKFQSSNFIDVNSNRGQITNLRTFKTQLLFWQQAAFGTLSVNERAITTDENSGQELILGSGGVLSRYDYKDETSGMHKDQYCDTQSNSALYWFDDHTQQIKSYSGDGVDSISRRLCVDFLMNKYADKTVQPSMMFDINNNEILSNVLTVNNKKAAIVYNEYGGVFTSIYDADYDYSIQFNNGQYLIKSTDNGISIAQWNCSDGSTPKGFSGVMEAYLKYVVNNNPLTTKVFDNQEIITQSTLDNREDYDVYFSKNHNYTFTTDLISSSSTLEDEMTLREGNYRYAIPRSTSEQKFGLRMRGKYMQCEITNTLPSINTGIQSIITKFRQSWI